jgi:excinuclease UvrABC ATPase subunit
MADYRIIICEACDGEGSKYVRQHEDDRYVGPCEVCEGTGYAVIEVEPIALEDLERM